MPEKRLPAPPPLIVAASLCALEGSALVVGAVVQLANLSSGRASLGVALAVFFAAYGALLVAAGVALGRVVAWPRGLALISQLILLGLAWGVRDHVALAIFAAVIGIIALVGLVHPDSIKALEEARNRGVEGQDGQESGSSD